MCALRPDGIRPDGISPAALGGIDALTSDGAVVRIRPVTPQDAAGLTALHERSSDDTLYRRFLSTGHHPIAGEVARLVRAPDATFAALVATERDRAVGVCSYELLPGTSQAEFAVFVDDTAHHRGIGTLLLEHLAVRARRHGIPDLLGEVLPSNSSMLRVVTGLGQPTRSVYDLGLVEVHLDTAVADGDVLDTRDLGAARRSLDALFAPASVAVVGAGRSPGGIGHAVLRAIVDGGFTGTVSAVNPVADTVAGVPAYPSIAAAPLVPDLVIIAVPAANVATVLADAAHAGTRAAVVLSSGFSEDGADGAARQTELVRIARSAGMRLVGPNCLGILTTDPAIRLHATFGANAVPGGLAVASQSGAVGITLLDQAAKVGLGVSSFVSLGNKADVSGNDLLSYWYDDPAAKVVALYLESLGNPRRFARIARAVARRKPILAVKSGRSIAGSRAGASHTAAAAAPDATVDALFAQAGVIRCDGLGDLLDTARMLVDQPLPAGGRVAIVGNAGGINVLCADAAESAGLTLADLPPDVPDAIRAAAPAAASVTNPVDLGAAATAESIDATIRAVAPHVDAVVVAFVATLASDVQRVVAAIGTATDAVDVPVAVVLLGVADAPTSLGSRRRPVYSLPEPAIAALGRAVRYATWRRTPIGNRPHLTGLDAARARTLVMTALAAGGGWVEPRLAEELLACYGIRVYAGRECATVSGAVEAATELGYPVVLKSADPALVHKSDIGGVRLGLTDPAEVAVAYRDVTTATGDDRVLVQSQAPAGVELIAGIAHDPLFGSLVMCGLGGVYTSLFGDRNLRLLPLTDRDATGMWRGLRASALLTGYRGSPAVDTPAIEDLLLRLGRLAEDLPEVAELDLNPVIATPTGVAVVDVKIRIANIGTEPDAGLRALREPG
jgi:acyl-CoA synthetase (NDP forming)/GNAT superfamily N-acetyltransferase